jgi:hypothetical protein
MVDSISPFLALAKDSVVESVADFKKKGTSIRLKADYVNSVVDALMKKETFKGYNWTEVKMAVRFWIEAHIQNQIATELKVTTE